MRSSSTHPLLLVILLLLLSCKSFAQDSSKLFKRVLSVPDKVFNRIDIEANFLDQKLSHQAEKSLTRIYRQAEKLKHKLWNQDPDKAKNVFGDVRGKSDQLIYYFKLKEGQIQSSVYYLDFSKIKFDFLIKDLCKYA